MTSSYNPLDFDNIAWSIGNALLSNPPVPLESATETRFRGAGIYAIYYVGDFPTYRLLADANLENRWAKPIYVGKAVHKGARRGLTVSENTTALFDRLREHRASVDAANNLETSDFFCRWLVVESIFIPLGETLLINLHQPVWNAVLDGFGNHDPGSGRRQGANSPWDVVHPGRAWALLQQPHARTAAVLEQEVQTYLSERLEPLQD